MTKKQQKTITTDTGQVIPLPFQKIAMDSAVGENLKIYEIKNGRKKFSHKITVTKKMVVTVTDYQIFGQYCYMKLTDEKNEIGWAVTYGYFVTLSRAFFEKTGYMPKDEIKWYLSPN